MLETYEETFYRVSLRPNRTSPGLCAGVWVNNRSGKVADAAPILRWSVGKPIAQLWEWVERHGGTVEVLER